MNKYKVKYRVCSYPNGKVKEEGEMFFDSYEEAVAFKEKNSWSNPMFDSHAWIYEYKPGWIRMER